MNDFAPRYLVTYSGKGLSMKPTGFIENPTGYPPACWGVIHSVNLLIGDLEAIVEMIGLKTITELMPWIEWL